MKKSIVASLIIILIGCKGNEKPVLDTTKDKPYFGTNTYSNSFVVRQDSILKWHIIHMNDSPCTKVHLGDVFISRDFDLREPDHPLWKTMKFKGEYYFIDFTTTPPDIKLLKSK